MSCLKSEVNLYPSSVGSGDPIKPELESSLIISSDKFCSLGYIFKIPSVICHFNF